MDFVVGVIRLSVNKGIFSIFWEFIGCVDSCVEYMLKIGFWCVSSIVFIGVVFWFRFEESKVEFLLFIYVVKYWVVSIVFDEFKFKGIRSNDCVEGVWSFSICSCDFFVCSLEKICLFFSIGIFKI